MVRWGKYQVPGNDGQFVVDTEERNYTCRKWELTGLSYPHAISALYYNNNSLESEVDDCYKVSTFMATYSHIFSPTKGIAGQKVLKAQ